MKLKWKQTREGRHVATNAPKGLRVVVEEGGPYCYSELWVARRLICGDESTFLADAFCKAEQDVNRLLRWAAKLEGKP